MYKRQLLVYASSWIKCHHPEIFCCAILNSQPLGFYAPAQLIRDARQHNVEILPICVERSYWDNMLEPVGNGQLAVRLGFRQIKGFKEEDGQWLSLARGNGYRSIDAIWRRAGLGRPALSKLAAADAFSTYDLSRREALWQVKGLGGDKPLPLFEQTGEGLPYIPSDLPDMSLKEEVFADYVATRLSLRAHPVELLTDEIGRRIRNSAIRDTEDRTWVEVCGLVITRQRPGTASGVIFITLEDESATANIVVWPSSFEQYRKIVMTGRLIKVSGRLQREGIVTHIIANKIKDLSYLLDTLVNSEDYGDHIDPTRNNPDEARNPIPLKDKPMTDKSARPPLPDQHYGTVSSYYNASGGARHPREQAKKLFPSRDFH